MILVIIPCYRFVKTFGIYNSGLQTKYKIKNKIPDNKKILTTLFTLKKNCVLIFGRRVIKFILIHYI